MSERCIGPGGNDYGTARPEERLRQLMARADDVAPLAPSLTPSPARDVPRVDHLTADVERLARFLRRTERTPHVDDWDRLGSNEHDRELRSLYLEQARAMVRDFDELEEILAEILQRGGRF